MKLTVAQRRRWLISSIAALSALGFSSCQTTENRIPSARLSGTYDQAYPRIIYRLDSSHSAKLLASLGTPDNAPQILLAGDEQQPSNAAFEQETSARLELIGSSNGRAWAFLTVASSPRRIFRLQIDAAEVALAIQGLAHDGLFTSQKRPSGGATIEVASESGTIVKEWTPEPRLDEISERVLTRGEEITSGDIGPAGRARVTVPVPPMPEN